MVLLGGRSQHGLGEAALLGDQVRLEGALLVEHLLLDHLKALLAQTRIIIQLVELGTLSLRAEEERLLTLGVLAVLLLLGRLHVVGPSPAQPDEPQLLLQSAPIQVLRALQTRIVPAGLLLRLRAGIPDQVTGPLLHDLLGLLVDLGHKVKPAFLVLIVDHSRHLLLLIQHPPIHDQLLLLPKTALVPRRRGLSNGPGEGLRDEVRLEHQLPLLEQILNLLELLAVALFFLLLLNALLIQTNPDV